MGNAETQNPVRQEVAVTTTRFLLLLSPPLRIRFLGARSIHSIITSFLPPLAAPTPAFLGQRRPRNRFSPIFFHLAVYSRRTKQLSRLGGMQFRCLISWPQPRRAAPNARPTRFPDISGPKSGSRT